MTGGAHINIVAVFRVYDDTRDAFEGVHGDVFKNFVPILADLDAERVADMGGMRFYNAHTHALLIEWPKR